MILGLNEDFMLQSFLESEWTPSSSSIDLTGPPICRRKVLQELMVGRDTFSMKDIPSFYITTAVVLKQSNWIYLATSFFGDSLYPYGSKK